MTIRRIALTALTSTALLAVSADAGTRSYSHVQNVDTSSGIRIQAPGEGVTNRSIVLPLNKSSVIELPENVMDVIVSNPDIVEAVVHTARRTVLIGKEAGQTNAYFYGHDGRELLNIDIRVETDINGLEELIAKNSPNSNVTVQAINSRILLTGSVPNASAAAQVEALAALWVQDGNGDDTVVNLLSIEGKDQVLLKVRIVEMERSVTKQLGFNLGAVTQFGDSTVSLFNNTIASAASGFAGNGTFTNSGGGDLRSLTGALVALESVGLVRTLAEPTLTAISGETANFLAGGEIPLLSGASRDITGNLVQSFEFKPFGVSLGFTPVVLSEGRINLNISTEVSEPTTDGAFVIEGGGTILGIRTRRANTVVELPAGGSLVIAGLIREEARNLVQGAPGIKDIPGLGALFRGRDDETTQTELVVIVTPYLVDPTHPDKLQTPLDGFSESNDVQSLLHGRINEAYNENDLKNVTNASFGGSFGHVVD
ncbi:MAG: type II and III secretion system protein family protein [Litorimonas sp.]